MPLFYETEGDNHAMSDRPEQYRKKPVVIDAVQLSYTDTSQWYDVLEWCGGTKVNKITTRAIIAIDTLEGTMTAEAGDWIIRGVKGEFYPCKPDVFAATYEPVERDAGVDR